LIIPKTLTINAPLGPNGHERKKMEKWSSVLYAFAVVVAQVD